MRSGVIRIWAFIMCGALLAAVLIASPSRTEALTGSSFDPGNIISDQKFFDAGSMSEDQIQAFLNSKVASCQAGYTCLKDYRVSTYSRAAMEAGHCKAYVGEANELASRIIFKTAQACGINPQTLLVLLEKETSLVTATRPTAGSYQKAMGYGCPDTSVCDSAFYGLYNQVYKSAWQFRQYTNYPARQYRIGAVAVGFNPNSACGSTIVNIKNQATANLYNYTPYQPNAAALANLGGTGDGCSSYGNRNFWAIFSNWFGPTTGAVDPMAYLDSAELVATADTASIELSGWALDPTDRSTSIQVHAYVDQPNGVTTGYVMNAQGSRPDVGGAYPGAGNLHGYSLSIPVKQSGAYRVCIFPIVATGGYLLTCKNLLAPPAAPVGTIDSVQIEQADNAASIVVGGWALDTSLPATVTKVHVYVDRPNGTSSGIALTANLDRPDIANAFPGAGPTHGYLATIPITSTGTYRVCAYAIGKPVFGQVAAGLGCRAVTAKASAPTGSLDTVALSTGADGVTTINVSGWALDGALPVDSIPVDLYVDKPDGTVQAARLSSLDSRADIARAFPEAGANHGFSSTVPVDQRGTYRVCAFAIGTSVFGAANSLIGCKGVSTNAGPTFGSLDSVSVTGLGADRRISASGWAADPAAPGVSIPVDIYVDGPTGSTAGVEVTGNLPRADVALAFPKYGGNHGFTASSGAAAAGLYKACAYAITVSRFGSNSLLGCATVSISK